MIAFKIILAGPIIVVEALNPESGAFAVQAWGGMYDATRHTAWIKLAVELETVKRLFHFNEVQFEVIEQ